MKKNLILNQVKKNSINLLYGLFGIILNVFPISIIMVSITGFKLVQNFKGYHACLTFLGAIILSLIALYCIIILGKFYKISNISSKTLLQSADDIKTTPKTNK